MLIQSFASKIEVPLSKQYLSKVFLDLHDCFNKECFHEEMVIPDHFQAFVETICNSFSQKVPKLHAVPMSIPAAQLDYKKVLLGFSGGLDSVAQLLLLLEDGYEVVPFSMFNVNFYENGQGNKACQEICDKLGLNLVKSKFIRCMDKENPFFKHWQENPMKNQMILAAMADYCIENGIGNMSLGDDFDLDIKDAKPGTNTTDAHQVTEAFLDGLKHYVPSLKFLPMKKGFNKLDRIKLLLRHKLQDLYYSCLQGRFTKMRHEGNQKKFNVQVFQKNCVCSCRKCSHHNLLLHYGGVKTFPKEMLEKCWSTLGAKTSADNVLFDASIPEEKRIKNLFEY